MATCPTCKKRFPGDATACPDDGERLLPDEAFSAVDADFNVGQVIGEYQIEGKLGEGGFGAVYRAVHPLIGKAAAIKVLNRQYSSNPQMVSRFIAEARAVNQIRHRNIIDIFSFGRLEDGRQYYVMELLEGMTFDAYLRERGRLPPEEAIPLLRGIARALDAAHANGIAHRDLKPENVFLVFDEDGGVFPKLLDFGIAKLLGDSVAGHKTRTGTPMGTPNYMSPEQCRGKNVDQRTDIYSFGIVAHETLAGRLPFDGDDVMDLLFKQTSAPAPPLSTVCPDLSPALDAPLLHMLEKDPAARPATVSAGIEALAAAARDAGYAVQVSTRKAAEPARPNEPSARTGDAASRSTGGSLLPRSTPGSAKQVDAFVEARTMVQAEASKTLSASAADVKAPGGRRAVFYVAGAVLLAGVGVLALRGRGPSDPRQLQPTALSMASPASSLAPAGSLLAPPPGVTPSAPAPSASAAPAVPAEVELTIQSTPPAVNVYLGAARLGSAPGPIHVKQGDGKVKLTFKAPGYRPSDVDVTPNASGLLSVTLTKAPAKQPGRPEIEY